MKELLTDWRILVFVYIVCTGVWGVVQKFASTHLNTATLSFVSVGCALLIVIAVSIKQLRLYPLKSVFIAAFGGVLGGVASVALYGALRRAPASVVIPLSSLSLVITVILSHIFLRETLGIRHIAGIISGLLAIFLLTK